MANNGHCGQRIYARGPRLSEQKCGQNGKLLIHENGHAYEYYWNWAIYFFKKEKFGLLITNILF
jgi:hypothetical protein